MGKAKVTVVSEQGKEAVVAVFGAGDFFGEGCLAGSVSGNRYHANHAARLQRAIDAGCYPGPTVSTASNHDRVSPGLIQGRRLRWHY